MNGDDTFAVSAGMVAKLRTYVDEVVELKFEPKIVASLPATGSAKYLYLVPASTPQVGDYYEEYIWIKPSASASAQWEHIGSTSSQVVQSFANLTGQPTDNANLAAVLSAKLDKNADITTGTKCKITYDVKGLVTGGADLAESDIPTLSQSKITNLVSDLEGKQPMLTAGTGISIVGNVISNTQTSAEWGNITGTLSTQTDLKDALDEKQDSALVTSISASSDDVHYPSAKCVYDAVSPKSVVTVSSTGTATDEVQYITIDGTEYKMAGGGSGSSIHTYRL